MLELCMILNKSWNKSSLFQPIYIPIQKHFFYFSNPDSTREQLVIYSFYKNLQKGERSNPSNYMPISHYLYYL